MGRLDSISARMQPTDQMSMDWGVVVGIWWEKGCGDYVVVVVVGGG